MSAQFKARDLAPVMDGAQPLRILAVLPTINNYGGVISLLNMLEEFLELGHHCVLATLSKYAKVNLVTRFSPIWLANPERAAALFENEIFDFAIASSWETVDVTLALSKATGAMPVYFVQDLEADFVKGIDDFKYAKALKTYELIETKVVKTQHLRRRLNDIGVDAHVIRPGMNLNIFYPRQVVRDGTFRVLAMARPNAPNGQRGFPVLTEAFTTLCAKHDGLRVGFFGDDELQHLNLPFAFEDFGRVGSKSLPALYSWSDVYIDASRFHGFGRTGVEAMACGSVVVLSDSGGIRDYCVDGENGLIVPVDDAGAVVAAVERLMGDRSLLEQLRAAGFETVKPFDDRIAAVEFLDVCIRALEGQIQTQSMAQSNAF
jgi:glycosyltransferase involved in cell wall biosynthesis